MAVVIATMLPASAYAQDPGHARPGGPHAAGIEIPAGMKAEHDAIHQRLVRATQAPGRTGEAARALARVLHPHFVREEQIALPPLGLLAPGTAWGEWSSEQLREIGLGFIPGGLQRWESFWSATFPDYGVPGFNQVSGYLISALLGVVFIAMVFWIFTFLGRRQAVKDAR